jgi:hypothetical protein
MVTLIASSRKNHAQNVAKIRRAANVRRHLQLNRNGAHKSVVIKTQMPI